VSQPGEPVRPGSRVVAAPVVFLGRPARPGAAAEWLRDGAVALDGDRILAVGPRGEVEARHGPTERLEAVLLPALVNAHTHLELSYLRGRVPGGEGLVPWVHLLLAARAREQPPEGSLEGAIGELREAGVAAVGEVTNTLAALPHLAAAGLAGTLFHEVFGFSAERIASSLASAGELRTRAGDPPPGLRIAPSPHAVYSTHPRVVAELLRGGPASIHLAEDPAERSFCAGASGPFAVMNRAFGATELSPLGRSPVAVAAPHLGARSLAVHVVDLDEEDRAALARSGATAVLCPRSNLHIGGRLPDVPSLMAAGVPLAVGTDSLASCPSLSPLAELAALHAAFPRIEPARLLPLAWDGPAVGAPTVGRLEVGKAPGILAARIDAPGALQDPAGWLVRELGSTGRRPTWIARHRWLEERA
jgi:cytosine/adenosine deaminase-related metal-dependent hydrolase